MCNGVKDCDDGSDEQEYFCKDDLSLLPKASHRVDAALCAELKQTLATGVSHCASPIAELNSYAELIKQGLDERLPDRLCQPVKECLKELNPDMARIFECFRKDTDFGNFLLNYFVCHGFPERYLARLRETNLESRELDLRYLKRLSQIEP
jgi:hypothetical protein